MYALVFVYLLYAKVMLMQSAAIVSTPQITKYPRRSRPIVDTTGNSLTKDIVVLLGITIVCSILTAITYEVRRVKLKKQKRAEAQADEEEELDYYNTQTV